MSCSKAEIKLNIHCTIGDKNAFGHIDLGAETSSVLPFLFRFHVSKSGTVAPPLKTSR